MRDVFRSIFDHVWESGNASDNPIHISVVSHRKDTHIILTDTKSEQSLEIILDAATTARLAVALAENTP